MFNYKHYKKLRNSRKVPPEPKDFNKIGTFQLNGLPLEVGTAAMEQLALLGPLLHKATRILPYISIPLFILFAIIHFMNHGPSFTVSPEYSVFMNPLGMYTSFTFQLEYLYATFFALNFVLILEYVWNMVSDIKDSL